MIQKELPVKGAGHAFVAQGDQRIIVQLLQRKVLAGKGSKGPAAHKHLIKGLQLHHFQAAFHLGRGGDDGKIHLAVFHGLQSLRRGVVGDAQADAGIVRVEGAQLFCKVDVQRSFGSADADRTVFQRGAGAQLFFCILDLHRRRCNAGVKQFTLRGKGNAAVGADEQHAIQLAFQPVHRVGDVGLVVAQHPRGFGEILIFRDIIKDFVIFPVHIHGGVPSFMSISYRDHVQDTFYTFSAC